MLLLSLPRSLSFLSDPPRVPGCWFVGAPLTAALTVSALVMVNVVAHLLLLLMEKARQAVVSLSHCEPESCSHTLLV